MATGGQVASGCLGSGTAAQSPPAQMSSWPCTRQSSSSEDPAALVLGQVERSTIGGTLVPTALMIVRVGIDSPLESRTSLGVAASTLVEVTTSTPSLRMRFIPNSTSLGCASGPVPSLP